MAAPAPAKDRFTSLDTLALVRELRALGPARIDKAFDDPGHGGWLLSLRAPGEGRRELRIVPGRYATLLPAGQAHSEELGPFARELRRLLSGAVLTEVADPKGERYLELKLRRGDQPEPLLLAVELFGKGNVVVVRGPTIVAVAFPKSWAQRTVRVGAEYRRAPGRGDPWQYGAAELTQALASSRTDRVSTLAARLSFGGPVAEELLARAGLPGSVPASESAPAAAEALVGVLRGLLAEVGEVPAGYLYRSGGIAVDVEPFPSRRFDPSTGAEMVRLPSFSAAAEEYFGSLQLTTVAPTPEETRRAGLVRQREQQEEVVARLEGEAAELRGQADAIFAHYAEAEAALASAPAAGDSERPYLEATLGETVVRLVPGRTPRETGQALYEEMKRRQTKLDGARAALGETSRALDRPAPAAKPRGPAAPARSTRRNWFEQYRWFLSSEGVLVVGGRDAASNDRIVKRYLGERDLYVHADLHGAPSVIIKHPAPGAPGPTEATLTEAGQWGLSFSKAWRAGRASGDAFWVTAEQVSKAPASGEFVARGAWVIHGTKHLLRDLPLELAIGTVSYESSELWMVAPPSAWRAGRGRIRARILPGEERERATVEVELVRELGLGRGELQSLLPAGGLRVLRA